MSVRDVQLAELRMRCCLTPEPTINQDGDDLAVWEVVCDSCGEPLCYVLNDSPDPCPFHTAEEGPHHVETCCYYAEEFDAD